MILTFCPRLSCPSRCPKGIRRYCGHKIVVDDNHRWMQSYGFARFIAPDGTVTGVSCGRDTGGARNHEPAAHCARVIDEQLDGPTKA